MNEIAVSLNKLDDNPLYEQLYAFIKQEIISGNYAYNTKLPSKRQLSSSLQCSQNTVQAAYGQLASEGYIVARPKSGYYISRLDGLLRIDKKSDAGQQPGKKERPAYRYEFSHHGVDLDNFPYTAWRRLTKEVINEYDPELLRTGDPMGHPGLRASIAEYLHGSRGVNCSPERIIISSGTEFLLQLLIQLLGDGFTYAIENPGYEKLNLLFKSNRVPYKAVPLDQYGMMPDALVQSGGNVACVTPSHQFPTGRIMPISRRIQLLNWANENPARFIVEDDYDSEFKYSGKPIPSLQSTDTGEKVIYIGAFSKSLTPALRVSYMVLPEKLLQEYYDKLSFYICPVPTIEQKTLHRFIEEGYFERHLNKMRNLYKTKRERLIGAIREQLPNAAVEGASAGLHFVLKPNNGMSEQELIDAAGRENVKVYGLSGYFSDRVSDKQPGLLLGFAAIRSEDIPEAVACLRKAWS